MKKILPFANIVVACTLLTSCAVIGINTMHITPKNAFVYPVFTEKDSLRGALNPYRTCYDVSFYKLRVTFNLVEKSISGCVDFRYGVVKSFDTLQFDLYANMLIDSIIYDGSAQHYIRKYDAVFVHFNKTQHAGSNEHFEVYYHGKPVIAKHPPWEGGFVWSTDRNKDPWCGVACEKDGASLWWPEKDHLSDEPDSMQMVYTVPEGLFCVANGVLTDSVTANKHTTYTWYVNYPINTYNATFYIGNFTHFTESFSNGESAFKLNYYVLPYNADTAKQHFRQVKSILKFYENKFGPYPWPKDGYKLVESPFAGMEHQSAIAYGNGYKDLRRYHFDHIILHETAHEWWGNSLTVPDYAEIWLHEGFATYSEALYVEYLFGKSEAIYYLNFDAMLIKNKRPVVGPHDVNFWEYTDTDVYMKGALMLHTLRNTLADDSLFFAIIKTYYNTFALKTVRTTDFLNVVNTMTGKDYTWFINQYLYDRTCPELLYMYAYNINTGKTEIYYKWSNAHADFSIPIKIKTGNRTFIIRPKGNLQKMELPTEKQLTMNTDGSYIALKNVEKF